MKVLEWLSLAAFLMIIFCFWHLRKNYRLFKPVVTILLFVSNKEQSIEGIMRRVLKIQQKLTEFELIVIDKNSFDQTPLILMKLSNRYYFNFIELTKNETDKLDQPFIHASTNLIYCIDIDNTNLDEVLYNIKNHFNRTVVLLKNGTVD